jgi:4-hydroxybenzoate polyprenyltransferase
MHDLAGKNMLQTSKGRALLDLIRFDKPIGTLLLLWPTLWALWIAAEGPPPVGLLVIFAVGTFLMRSAGCIVNDLADRNLDGGVTRTSGRPLVTGAVSVKEATTFFLLLMALAFALVLLTNPLTVKLSFVGALLASIYPLMKRITHLPQLVLGLAFSWGIPMAFAAVSGELPVGLWLLVAANFLWTVVYDTKYAMVDREDDLVVGIKSTAILFGRADRVIIALLQVACLACWWLAGNHFELGAIYRVSLLVVVGLFGYHLYLIRNQDRDACFRAFRHNNWVGLTVFLGIALDYALTSA